MMNRNCQDIQTRFVSLLAMQELHRDQALGEIDSQDINSLLLSQDNIERVIYEIKDIINSDKYEVALRDKIAKHQGLSFVSAFSSSGSAIGVPKDPSSNELKIVLKSGPSLTKSAEWFQRNVNERGANRYGVKSMSFVDMTDDMFLIKVHCVDNKTNRSEVNRYLFLDDLGSVVGEAFDNAYSFSEGLAVVADESEHAFIMTKQGQKIPFPDGYTTAFLSDNQFRNGRLLIEYRENEQYEFIDKQGHTTMNGEIFDRAQDFSEGVAAVKHVNEDTWTFIDTDGNNVFPDSDEFRFDYASAFSQGIAAVRKGGEWYILRKDGAMKNITPNIQEYSTDPLSMGVFVKEGIVHVRDRRMRTLYIDSAGSNIGYGFYQMGGDFNEGFAAVQWDTDFRVGGSDVKSDRGYIDKKARNETISDFFIEANSFHHGVAKVWKENKTYYIDKKGRRVFGA